MKLDYFKDHLKNKKELVPTVRLGVSVLCGILILVKVTSFFVASARAESVVKRAIEQNVTDPNNIKKQLASSAAITDELKKKYYKKSRRNSPKNIVSGIMNSGKTKLRILDCNFSKIITKLRELLKNRIINDDVVSLDVQNCIVTTSSGKKLNFNKVISTVNYEIYKSLTKKVDDTKYFANVHFTFVRIIDNEFNKKIKGYKFVYMLDDKYYFYRITNLDNKNFYVLESVKMLNISKNQELINSIFLKNCKIIKDKKLEDTKNITFLGRFASVDSSIKIHDVIKKVLEIKKNEKKQ